MPDTAPAEPGPTADLDELAASHGRLLGALAGPPALGDGAARAASALPGWSRGHVLTHLARNADGLGNLVHWARTGDPTPMYASAAAREADIEAGSGRPAEELLADLAAASRRIAELLGGLDGPALDALVETGPARVPTRAAELVSLRVREVEIHHVDLGLDYTPASWPASFVLRTLGELVPRLAAQGRLPVSALVATGSDLHWGNRAVDGDGLPELHGPASALLGWLVGRVPARSAGAAGLVVPGGGDVPSAPAGT